MAELSRLGQPDQSGWTTLDRIGAAARKAREYISPWGVVSPTDVAGFAPGGGLVQAWQDSGRGLANLKAGNYGQAAADYGSMALNTAGELLPVAKLGMAMLPAAKGINALADVGKVEPQGITAYHGSPHDFDRFDMSKIGTGEGAQAYGHGLYFAESEDVARGYRNALSPGMGDAALRAAGLNDADLRSLRQFTQTAVDPDVALRDWLGWTGKKETPELRVAFMQEWNARKPGSLYQVRINANPDDFLDWDKPLSEQSERVRKSLSGLGVKSPEPEFAWNGYSGGIRINTGGGGTTGFASFTDLGGGRGIQAKAMGKELGTFPNIDAARAAAEAELKARNIVPEARGSNAYGMVAGARPDSVSGANNPDAARILREAGIPGIKYLDAGSRGAGDGTRNYVVFDDKLVEILKKYGWVPGMAIPAAAMMEYQQQGGSAPQM